MPIEDDDHCPRCYARDGWWTSEFGVDCWNKDSDQIIKVHVIQYHCGNCDHAWQERQGQPLSDCECEDD